MAQVAANAADAGRLQSGEDQTCRFVSCAETHARLNARHARRSDGGHCRTAWPCRHANDGKALRAPGAELYRRYHSCPLPDAGDCRGKHGDSHPGQKTTASGAMSAQIEALAPLPLRAENLVAG